MTALIACIALGAALAALLMAVRPDDDPTPRGAPDAGDPDGRAGVLGTDRDEAGGRPPAGERTGPPIAGSDGASTKRAQRRAVATPRIRWRRSRAIGSPAAGRVVRGVRLPHEGRHFFTWDPVLRRRPNRGWRRFGTDRLVRLFLRVARDYRAAHPRAPRIGVGDLSRPRGGDFGPRFGYIGHATHQNGLDVDVYYPRRDRRERAPRRVSQIDRRLSQALLERFLAKPSVVVVYVGPATGLTGPPGRVQALVNHDNHMHVRIR